MEREGLDLDIHGHSHSNSTHSPTFPLPLLISPSQEKQHTGLWVCQTPLFSSTSHLLTSSNPLLLKYLVPPF